MGLSGPAQTYNGFTGENITSYIRVYNDGNGTGKYRIAVLGNVSGIAWLETSTLVLGAGENRRVEIVYVAPAHEAHYEGVLIVSLEGEQIVPGVTWDISVGFSRPPANRPPTVAITFPKEGEILTGDVDVAVQGDDPDGDPLSFRIMINGELVAEEPTYLWRTRKWPNGEYELSVVASDSDLSSAAAMRFVVHNARGVPPWVWALGAVVALVGVALAGALMLALLFRIRRRRSRRLR